MAVAASTRPRAGGFPVAAVVVVAVAVVMSLKAEVVWAEPEVPCFFIFGDSLVDNGNNNRLTSLAKANYMPYGIDFLDGPTGRFSNGKTSMDVITESLGFTDYSPPFIAATGDAILKGLNYASAAAGILEETGWQLGDRVSFSKQVENYKTTVSQMINLLGDETAATTYLSKCIYAVVMGSNDYLNNYFMPRFYSASRDYTPEQFSDLLIQQYSQQLKVLYNYGARKMALIGLGLIGCIPSKLAQNNSTCAGHINTACQIFNSKLKWLVHDFNRNRNLTDAKFTYINAYGMFEDLLDNSRSYGFKITNAGCCGLGRNNGQITCLPLQTPCENRNEYVFWDAFHPTEAANWILGRRTYSAQSSSDAYPVDIHGLAQL